MKKVDPVVRSTLSLESEQRVELIPAEPRCRRHAHPDSEVVLLDPLPDARNFTECTYAKI